MSKVSTLLCQEGNVVRGMMVKPTNLLPFLSINSQQEEEEEGDQKEEGEQTKRQETG